MILSALKQHLINSGVTTPIYMTFQPSDPDTCITLITVPGSNPDLKHNYNSPAFQMMVRSNNAETAETLAYTVFSALHGIGTQTISGIFFSHIAALQDPFILKYDERQRPIYICNYETEIYKETTNRI